LEVSALYRFGQRRAGEKVGYVTLL
jgi:hypothetical protein